MRTEIEIHLECKTDDGWKWTQLPEDVEKCDYAVHIDLIGLFSGLEGSLQPIRKAKGLPADSDPKTRLYARHSPFCEFDIAEDGTDHCEEDHDGEEDGASYAHSWLTIKEIDAHPWDEPNLVCYEEESYKKGKEKGQWTYQVGHRAEDIWPKTRPIIPEEQYLQQRESGTLPVGKVIYVQVKDGTPRDHASILLEEIMPFIRPLGAPDQVRLVFWFREL